MDKAGICRRLAKSGLREAADAYKEEVRSRRKASGETRDKAGMGAWSEMWDSFRPAVERWEMGQGEGDAQLTGCPDDVDQFLDPDYHESDPGKWLRDGLIWTAAEIRRVVIDSSEGTTVDLTRAKTKPPTAWAIFCLESFARKTPDKRGELIARVLPFATRSHDPPGIPGDDEGSTRGFLDGIS